MTDDATLVVPLAPLAALVAGTEGSPAARVDAGAEFEAVGVAPTDGSDGAGFGAPATIGGDAGAAIAEAGAGAIGAGAGVETGLWFELPLPDAPEPELPEGAPLGPAELCDEAAVEAGAGAVAEAVWAAAGVEVDGDDGVGAAVDVGVEGSATAGVGVTAGAVPAFVADAAGGVEGAVGAGALSDGAEPLVAGVAAPDEGSED